MPRPCAVESHARRYTTNPLTSWDATALRRGVSRSPLQKQTLTKISQMPRPCAVESHARRYKNNPSQKSLRCHGLAPWSLTLATTKTNPSRCHGPICSCGKMKLECTRYLTNVPTIVSTSRAPFRILLSRLSAISHPSIPTVFTVSFTQTLRTRQSDAPLQH